MRSSAVAFLGLTSLVSARTLVPRKWKINEDSCDEGKRDVIKEELDYAIKMADAATGINTDSLYFKTFFSDAHLGEGDSFRDLVRGSFGQISTMLKEGDGDYEINITCDQSTTGCAKKGWWAHMNDVTKNMNLCNKFFDVNDIKPTKDRLGECDTLDLRLAQRSRGAILVHEASHTSTAMSGRDKSKDYAYGLKGTYLLPRGGFDRSCVPYAEPAKILCPSAADPAKEGVCPADLDIQNADTWSFVAAGMYFSAECGKEIPLPNDMPAIPGPPPPSSKRLARAARHSGPSSSPLSRRAEGCPDYNDVIVIDGEDDGAAAEEEEDDDSIIDTILDVFTDDNGDGVDDDDEEDDD